MPSTNSLFAKKSILPLLLSIIGLGLAYGVLLAIRPTYEFWSLDEGGKFLHMQSMIHSGDPGAPLEYPGAWLDEKKEFIPLYFYGLRDGELRSWWPIAFPLVTIPFFRLLGWYGIFLLPLCGGLISAFASGCLVLEALPGRKWAPLLAFWVTGIATPILFYSIMFWEHTISAACFTMALLLILIAWKKERTAGFVLAGIVCSLGCWFRSETLFLSSGLFLALLFRRRKYALTFACTLAVSALGWMWLNQQWMGNILTPQFEGVNGQPLFGYLIANGWKTAGYIFFDDPKYFAVPLSDEMLLASLILVAGWFLSPWLMKKPVAVVVWFAGAVLLSAYILLSPYGDRSMHGFLAIAPFIGLSGLLFAGEAEDSISRLRVLILCTAIVFWFVYFARAWQAAGGLQWGPRYLLAFYPFLVAAAVIGLWKAWPRWNKLIRSAMAMLVSLALAIGIGFEIHGEASVNFALRSYAKAEKSLEAHNEDILLTRCSWMTMMIPRLYWRGNIFLIPTLQSLDSFEQIARRKGMEEATWLEMVSCWVGPEDALAKFVADYPDGIIATPFRLDGNGPEGVFTN